MIPILYESNETAFTSNGVCRLVDCVSCEVTEGRNGVYECEFTYPITGRNYDKIKEGMIIYTTHDESGEPQPFDIYKRSVPIDGVVTFNAAHISYRLRNYILKPFTAASISATFASLVPNATPASCPFTFWTDKEVESAFTLNVPKSIRSVLGGEEGSILDVYGTGEYEFDRFAVKLHLHRGQDTNVKIQYGKNLIDLTDETDAGNLYNAVVPYWLSSEEGAAPVMLAFPYYVTASDFDPETEQVIPIVLDLSANFQEEPTAEQLAARARAVLDASETRKGTRTIEVDFVQLWQTEQYKDIAPLERLNLCDTVEVIYGGTSVAQKITTVVYDSLLDRYKSMELGATTQTLADALMASMERAISEPVQRALDKTAAAIKHATDMITGNDGGYVVIRMNENDQPMELLICDTPDYLTAQNVWRWNQNGLGFSSNGYAGPYGTAITADGSIVADYITTGTISSKNGRTTWDLNRGNIRQSDIFVKERNEETGVVTYGLRGLRITSGFLAMFESEEDGSKYSEFFNIGAMSSIHGSYAGGREVYNIGFRLDPPGPVGEGPVYMMDFNNEVRIYDYELKELLGYPSCLKLLDPMISKSIFFGDLVHSEFQEYWRMGLRHYYTSEKYYNYTEFVINNDTLSPHGFEVRYGNTPLIAIGTSDNTPSALGNYLTIHNPIINYSSCVIDGRGSNALTFKPLNGKSVVFADSDGTSRLSVANGGVTIKSLTTHGDVQFRDDAKKLHAEIVSGIDEGSGMEYVCLRSRSSNPLILSCNGRWSVFISNGTIEVPVTGRPDNFQVVGTSYFKDGDVYVDKKISCASLEQRSDARYKNVFDWDDRFDVLIDKLRPVLFDWKERKADDYHHLGLIAQEVEKEMHALGLEDCIVHTAKDGEKSIAYSEVSTLLLKKVQQQQKKIDALEARLARLEALIGG